MLHGAAQSNGLSQVQAAILDDTRQHDRFRVGLSMRTTSKRCAVSSKLSMNIVEPRSQAVDVFPIKRCDERAIQGLNDPPDNSCRADYLGAAGVPGVTYPGSIVHCGLAFFQLLPTRITRIFFPQQHRTESEFPRNSLDDRWPCR
jgi:hypothetical protein